ncbi:unnamed protein product [Rhizophagus irregularis]|nr:unnamed protein product [Rhizophagus irregularis]
MCDESRDDDDELLTKGINAERNDFDQRAAPSPKTINTVMTGYEPMNKDLIREIMVYDIPFTWSQLDTLNHLKAWGQVVAIKFKSQQKYVTVTVSIELNQVATGLWNEGVWTAPLGGLPVQ